jgi:hypothetical protein
MEKLLDNQAKSFAGYMKGGSSGSTPSSAGGGSFDFTAPFLKGTTALTGAFIQLGTGSLQLKDVFNGIGAAAGVLGPFGAVLGDAAAKTGGALYDMNSNFKDVSKSGVYLGNNLGLFNSAVVNAKMTTADFAKVQEQYGTRLAGLGSNMDKSALTYLKLGAEIQNDPLVYKLQAMGMSIEETNKILITTASNRRNMDMMSEKAARQTADATIQLAVEMDNTARLTGQSREEQRKLLDEQTKRTDVKLAMQLMTPEQKAAFEQTNVYVGRMGAAATNVARIFATGGPKNADDTKAVAAMDPKMQGLIRELVQETEPGKRKEIQQRIDLAAMEAANDKSRIQVAQGLVASNDAVAKQNAEVLAGQMEYGNIQTQLKREYDASKDKDKMTLAQFQEANYKRVAEEREKAGTGKGSEGEKANASQTLNQMDRALKDITSGTGVYFNKLNIELGDSIKNFRIINGRLGPITPEQAAAIPGNAATAVKDKLGIKKVEVPEAEKRPRRDGSLGAVGSFMEDWGKGTPAMLHGKEGVITEKQFQGLFGDLGKQVSGGMPNPNQMQNMLSGVAGGLKGDLEKAKQSIPTTDTFEKMFSQIKMPDMGEMTRQMASSMPTGSGSTTDGDAMTEVAKGVDQLNMRIERLINAVEDGSSKSVKALKSRGNMIA